MYAHRRFAFRRFAHSKTAPGRNACCRFAPFRLALHKIVFSRFAPFRFASARFAPVSWKPDRFTPERSAPTNWALDRSARGRGTSGGREGSRPSTVRAARTSVVGVGFLPGCLPTPSSESVWPGSLCSRTKALSTSTTVGWSRLVLQPEIVTWLVRERPSWSAGRAATGDDPVVCGQPKITRWPQATA
jgi:hypothetical protein